MRFLTNLMMNVNRFLCEGGTETTTPETTAPESVGAGADKFNTEGIKGLGNSVWETVKDILAWVMPIVLAVVTAFGVFFAIKLGIAYAQAETTEKREEAKKRLVGAIIGFGIGIIAAALMWWLSQSTLLSSLFDNSAA